MRIQPEIAGSSIVLVGNFNPVIFHPEWFRRVGVFSDADYDAARVEVLHPEIGIVEMDWLNIKVETQRFVADSSEEPFAKLLDFVLRVFGEFLVHTPINVVGINYRCHFPVKGQESADRIGLALAPREPWGEWGALTTQGAGTEHGGCARSLSSNGH